MCGNIRNYVISNYINNLWYKAVKLVTDTSPQKYETLFMELTNRQTYIIECDINSTISTTTNNKISWHGSNITAIVRHHKNQDSELETSEIYKVLK